MSRTLPHSLDAEIHVLGGCLLYQRGYAEVASLVSPGDFYHPAHVAIFGAMAQLDRDMKPIDPLTVADQMRSQDTFSRLKALNGEGYFAELTSAVVTVENIAWHAKVVRGKATARRIIEAATEIAAKGFGEYGDVEQYAAEAEQAIMRAAAPATEGKGAVSLRRALRSAGDAIEARWNAKGALTGIPSGFAELDDLTSGWQPTDLVILAARPSMGKTAFAVQCLEFAADGGVPGLLFSAEMSQVAVALRLIGARGQIDSNKMRRGLLEKRDWERFSLASAKLASLPLWLDDSTPSLAYLRSEARRWRRDPAAGGASDKALIVIDYMQLIRTDAKQVRNREQEVAEISRGLKALAKELNCPVIALSQLNRGVESRTEKRPGMADLRDSGQIEQDADVIAFLYRDEVYNPETRDPGVAEVIVSKQRNGSIGALKLGWQAQFTRFVNLSSREAA